MHYMFVDESGTAQIRRAAARTDAFYIRCGLIVHMDDVHRARGAVDRTKRELFSGKDTMKWELHGYEIWRGRGRFAHDLHIPRLDEKLKVFARTVEAIEESGAVLTSVIIDKNRLPSGRHNLLKLSWRMITESFEEYLAYRGDGEHGNIVADASRRGTEAKIGRLLQDMHVGTGRPRGPLVLVSKDMRLVNSLSEPLVQAADMAAYIMHKHYAGNALFGGQFDALMPCMWQRDGNLEGFGITHYPDRR